MPTWKAGYGVAGSWEADPEADRVVARYVITGTESRRTDFFISLVLMAAFPVFALVASAISGAYPATAGAMFVLAGIGSYWYRGATRHCVSLELTRTTLRWRSLFREGEVPLHLIRSVHRVGFASGMTLMKIEGQKGLYVTEQAGLGNFLATLAWRNPSIELRGRWSDGLGLGAR